MDPTKASHDSEPESLAQAAASAAREMSSDVAEGAAAIRERADRDVRRLGESARDWWQQQKEGARHVADSARQQAAAWGHSTEDYVRRQPYQSMAAAAGIGALVAVAVLLLSRRSR